MATALSPGSAIRPRLAFWGPEVDILIFTLVFFQFTFHKIP